MKFLCFILLTLFFGSCDTRQVEPIICAENCDSLHYNYTGDQLSSIQTYFNGRPEGLFVLLDKADSVFGYDQYIGDYLKRTLRTKTDERIVKLFYLDHDYKLVEIAVYANGELVDSLSHCLLLSKKGERFLIQANTSLGSNNIRIMLKDTIFDSKEYDGQSILIPKDEVADRLNENSSVFVYQVINKVEGFDESGFSFPLNPLRFEEDMMLPYEW